MINENEGIHDPVNIGNPREMTIYDLARIIQDITHCPSEITIHPLPQDDPKVRQPDITKAKRLLKWEPKVEVEEGLIYAIEDFKKRLGLSHT